MKFFTDHRNFLTLFADETRCNKSNRDNKMDCRYYTIHHIDDEYDYLADLVG